MFGTDAHADVSPRRDLLISAIFFTWFFAACVWTVNALRRPVPPGGGFPPLWLPGMIISELAPLYLVGRAVIAAGFLALGAAELQIGRAGLVLFALSEVGLTVLIARTFNGARVTGHAPPWWSLFQLVDSLPDGVEHTTEVPYWEDLTLDVLAKPDARRAPSLIYVHPGSWMRGRPGRQARAMMHRLADQGWVVLDIRYPLSQHATREITRVSTAPGPATFFPSTRMAGAPSRPPLKRCSPSQRTTTCSGSSGAGTEVSGSAMELPRKRLEGRPRLHPAGAETAPRAALHPWGDAVGR
jgi:hypothetical protein